MKNKITSYTGILLTSSILMLLSACGTGSSSTPTPITPQLFVTQNSTNIQSISVESGQSTNITLWLSTGNPPVTQSSVLINIKTQEENIATVTPSQCTLSNNGSCPLTVTGVLPGKVSLEINSDQVYSPSLGLLVPVMVTAPIDAIQ